MALFSIPSAWSLSTCATPIKPPTEDTIWSRCLLPRARTKLLLLASMLLVAAPHAALAAQEGGKKPTSTSARATSPSAAESQLANLRAEVIRRTEAARENLVKLLAAYEQELGRRTEELALRREFYARELISRAELEETERGVAQTRANIQQ